MSGVARLESHRGGPLGPRGLFVDAPRACRESSGREALRLRIVAWGAGPGCVLSGFGLWALRLDLYGTGLVDPRGWVVVAVCSSVVSGAACWIPARRAVSLHPTVALRNE